MQQKGIKRRAYAASLSLLGGKSSKMPKLGQGMPNFGDYCQGRIPLTKATEGGRSQQLDTAHNDFSPARAHFSQDTAAAMEPTPFCSPYKSPISDDEQCFPAGRSGTLNGSCMQPEHKQKERQRRVKRREGRVKAKHCQRNAGHAAGNTYPPPEAGASSPALDLVRQPTPKARQASPPQAHSEEQEQKPNEHSTELGGKTPAEVQKADALKDLVKRLEGRAEKVALDLRLEHASREMRASKAQASLVQESLLKRGGDCSNTLQTSADKLSGASLPTGSLSPDKQPSDKDRAAAKNIADEGRKPEHIYAEHKTEAKAKMQTGSAFSASPAFDLDNAHLMLGGLSTKTKSATSQAADCPSQGRKSQACKSHFAEQSPLCNLESNKMHFGSPDWSPQISNMPHNFGRHSSKRTTPMSDCMFIDSSRANHFQQYHSRYSPSPDEQRGVQVNKPATSHSLT